MMKTFMFVFLFVCLFVSASFAAAEEQTLSIRIESAARANVNNANQASPLPISVFLLSNSEAFNKANYFNLEDSSRQALGGSYVAKRSLTMLPNQEKNLNLAMNTRARYIGFIGGYNKLTGKRWREVLNLSDLKAKNVIARFTNAGIVFRYTEKILPARKGMYAEGNLGYSLLSASSSDFYYGSNTKSLLTFDKQVSYGQLGLSAGYEWQRGYNNLLNSLHLEKFSVGVGFYFTPVIKLSGQVDTLSKQHKPPYTVTASSEAIMLEGKINFFRINSWTAFINAAFGSVQYQNHYERESSDGFDLTTNNDNSSMTYTLGLGLEYDYDEQISMNFGYEFYSPTILKVNEVIAGDTNSKTSPDITINTSTLAFKLRYLF